MKTSPPSTPASVSLRFTVKRNKRLRGVTLVEVLIAAMLFTLLSTGLTAAFLQNTRMVKTQAYRTQAINTAMSVMEQLRSYGYAELRAKFYEGAPITPLQIQLPDPTNNSTIPKGYRTFDLPLNTRGDGSATVTLPSTITLESILIESDATAPRMPMRFWLSINRDFSTTSTPHAVFCVTLIYQWQSPGIPGPEWNTGNVKLVVPKLTLDTRDM